MALALKTLVQVLRRQGILVLISDYLSPLEQFEKPLKLAAKKFDLIPVVVTDKLERGLPACAACMTVVDPETGQEGTLALTAAMNQRLQEDARQRTEKLTKLFNPLKVEPITVDTAQPAADPVIAFFRRRTRQLKR